MPHVLENHWDRFPALSFLRENGQLYSNATTSFPTMTASVDCSLMTGVYPDQHRVPGLIWYDPDSGQIVNYINGAKTIIKMGIGKCLKNALISMNSLHLSKETQTIFEVCAERGWTSASINFVIHRGKTRHPLRLWSWVKRWLSIPLTEEIQGPDIMTLGRVVRPDFAKGAKGRGVFQSLGVNDTFASDAACRMIREGHQPDLTMVYLPDNDHAVHLADPHHAAKPLMKADQHIGTILSAYGSWDKALEQTIFLIVSDHGQTAIPRNPAYNIDLDQELRGFHIPPLGEQVSALYDLVLANNERMTYAYPLKPGVQKRLIDRLKNVRGIDQIAWKEDGGVKVVKGGLDAAALFFRKGGEWTDPYRATWLMEGNSEILDLELDDTNHSIKMKDYPDVLSRLYGALYSQSIPMVVLTALPRYEFKTAYFPTHLGGGSHGSLHSYDSTIPMIISGTDIPLPNPPRLIDLKDYMLQLLGTK